MKELRRSVLLPVFQLSQLARLDDNRANLRTIKQGKGHPSLTYRFHIVRDEEGGRSFSYNLFPVVLDSRSAPWALGMLFILSQLEAKYEPVISTAHSIADGLGAFREWLDRQDNPEELLFSFPKTKFRRITYRFHGFLNRQLLAGEIDSSTANRRMGTVIRLYRWLASNSYFTPDFPPWEETTLSLSLKTKDGLLQTKKVLTTDLSFSKSKSKDDFDGTILDGGKLRPLDGNEQDWIIEAAEAKGNTECLLLQLFMLSTGARIESACTLRSRHFEDRSPRYSKNPAGGGEVYRLKAGPGTGIETKNNRSGTFIVQRELYELLRTYANSSRAGRRRERYIAKHGPHADIYLFLTQQGNPYYVAKNEAMLFDPNFELHHVKNGQTIRQFITEQAIPYIREKYDERFHYRPHDLRASFGMNLTEELTKQVEAGTISLHAVRNIVKDLMWHSSTVVTDRYLNHKNKLHTFYKAIDGYGEDLQRWANRAMEGLAVDE
jgi:hypothetical protein